MTLKDACIFATLILIAAKVTVAQDMSWWLVFGPVWLPLLVIVMIMAIGLLAMGGRPRS